MSEVLTMTANQLGIGAVRRALMDMHLPPPPPPMKRKRKVTWRWFFYPSLAVVTVWAFIGQPGPSDASMLAQACNEDPSFTITQLAQTAASKELWSPSTATFRSISDEQYNFKQSPDCSWTIAMWVDTQNDLGT